MAKDNLFEDFTRVASGAFSALSGVRDEIETRIREQVERMLARLDLVTREEFEAQRDMLALARSQLETLEARLAALETKPAGKASKAAKAASESVVSEPGSSANIESIAD